VRYVHVHVRVRVRVQGVFACSSADEFAGMCACVHVHKYVCVRIDVH